MGAPFRLDGRVAVVTGGSRGLGAATARALADAGADVAVVGRAPGPAAAKASAIADATGRACRGYGADLADAAQVDGLVQAVLRDFGRVDTLVNNAGINERGAIERLSPETFLAVQRINVAAPWLLCRAFAAALRRSDCARVVNVGSVLSVVGMAERTPYATSKGALLQLTRSLALEWAPAGITVNCVLPGPFETGMNDEILADRDAYEAARARIPLGRWGAPRELGGLVVFLASDASGFITGAAIPVDGGWTAM